MAAQAQYTQPVSRQRGASAWRGPLPHQQLSNTQLIRDLQQASTAAQVHQAVQQHADQMHAVALNLAWRQLARAHQAATVASSSSARAVHGFKPHGHFIRGSSSAVSNTDAGSAVNGNAAAIGDQTLSIDSRDQNNGNAVVSISAEDAVLLSPGAAADTSAVASHLDGLLDSHMRGYRPRQVSNTLHSFAALGIRNRSRILALLRHAAPLLGHFTPQELANTAWSLGKLSVKPPRDWWPLFYGQSLVKLQRMQPGELSMLLWGLRQLKAPPASPDWLDEAIRAATEQLRHCPPHNIANILAGLAHVLAGTRSQPPRHANKRAAPQAATTLQSDVGSSHSLPAGGQLPAGAWEQFADAALTACGDCWAAFDAQAMSQSLLALSSLGVGSPSKAWLQSAMPHVVRLLPALTPVNLTHILLVGGGGGK